MGGPKAENYHDCCGGLKFTGHKEGCQGAARQRQKKAPAKTYPRRKATLFLSLEPAVMARLQALADKNPRPLPNKLWSPLNVTALELLMAGLEAAEEASGW